MGATKLKTVKAVMDGWFNLLSGLGVSGKDKRVANEVQWERMPRVDAENIYASDDVAAKVADTLPEEAFREGIKLKNIEKPMEMKICAGLERFCVDERLNEGWVWGRVFGGAGVLMVVDDGMDLSDPMDPDRVRKLDALQVFNRWELSADEIENDLRSPEFGTPISYRLSSQSRTSEILTTIHASRLLKFGGSKLPKNLFIQNQYWDDSIFTRLLDALRNYNSVHNSVASVMQDFTTDVFKIKNLAELVAAGKEDQVKTRIELANYSKSVIRAMVLDLEEDYEVKARSLAGVPDVIKNVDERMTVAAKMPHTLMLGQSPSGLGATGNSEERNWYNYVARQQELVLKKKYNILIPLIAKTEGVVLPADWSWEFKPLWQMSETEEAAVRKTTAETDQIYISNGVLDPSEVAASRFGGEEYSMDTVIDVAAREKSAQVVEPEPKEEPKTEA